jgi:DNA-binding HxlR family transcriptional regulator
MPLPKDYSGQECSLARALEIVGERWTLLIVRDAFFGVRRFGDFVAHLDIPRAVLAERLSSLTSEGVLSGASGAHGHTEYVLTGKGLTLWPVVWSLLAWGDEHYSDVGPRRVFQHAADGAPVGSDGTCAACGQPVSVMELMVAPGPGLTTRPGRDDPVSAALASPHHLLEPVRP